MLVVVGQEDPCSFTVTYSLLSDYSRVEYSVHIINYYNREILDLSIIFFN
jgi:hypothetical protein